MKVNFKSVACGLVLSAVFFCGKQESVRLSVDFSSKNEWRYTMTVDLRGTITTPDTQRAFASLARCVLIGDPVAREPAMLHFKACSVSITAPLLTDAEKANLIRQCNDARFTVNVNKGSIVPDDPDNMPLVKIGEWDLYKDVAKVLPALPPGRVRKGYSWDREKQIPLETKHYNAVGHLFQSFTLDSISSGRRALVSWKFTYGVETKYAETLSSPGQGDLGNVPTKGSGRGNAVLIIGDKTLEKAAIHFSVPSTGQGKTKISWNEVIELVRQK